MECAVSGSRHNGPVTTVQRSGLGRYASLLGTPGALTAAVVGTVARLPVGMTPLALLLLVQQETGSFGLGGLASGAYSAALAITAPVRGTGVDRRGGRSMLLSYGVVHATALVGCIAAAVAGLPAAVVIAAALAAGATFPPIGSVVRSLWGLLFEDEAERTTAYALDAVLIETAFIGGPLLVGVAVSVSGPASAVALAAGLVGVGSLVMALSPVTARLVPQESGARVPVHAPLRSAVVRRLFLALVVLGVAFGATEVAVAAYAVEAGSPHLVGPILAVWAVGSVIGGLTYGSRAWGWPAERQYLWLLVLLATGLALPLLAIGTTTLILLLMVAGAAIAPFSACNSTLLAAAAPRGATAATFAWSGSSIVAGIAVGTSGAGWLVDHTTSAAGFALAGGAGAAALATWLGSDRPWSRRTAAVTGEAG